MSTLCLNTFAFSPFAGAKEPVPLPELLAAVRAAGFDGIGLDVFTVLGYRRPLAELAAEVAAAGLGCPEMLGFVVDEDEDAALAGARQVAEACAAFGSAFALGMVVSPPDARCADLFARCAEIVAAAGARAAVEFLPFTPIATIADARTLVAHAGTANSGVLVDAWHFFQGADTWETPAALPVAEIAYVQVDDHPELLPAGADLYTECMSRRVMPGDGVFDLGAFRDALAAKGYDGPVSVEVINPELVALGPAEYASAARAAVGRFWA
ncbi:sugar phosphate isomerase/epimerase family protein [Embleya sp. NBC_00896]|uniref:sugar phosphate isomerase/epimerase family protein n=1 Tax=Embleya sp. NBC_00896 TaxID=2975961 RepID=UPI003865B4DC|nr:sugar phosphate isomerase/epimerase [Embleya sp. NBC_00896]